jgi:hypothetical protein
VLEAVFILLESPSPSRRIFIGSHSLPPPTLWFTVSVLHPRLGHICKTRGFAAEPTLELLISNPLDFRAPVAPTLKEWDLRPLVSNRTLRGSDFFEHLTWAARGVTLTR